MRKKETSKAFRADRKSGWNTWLFSGFRGFAPMPHVATLGFSCGIAIEKDKNDHQLV